MSSHDEDRLSRGLHDRAGDVGGSPFDLADVKRSAKAIRRRRRVTTALVAAAVVAIAVPVGLSTTGTDRADRPVGPVGPATPSTSGASPSPTVAPTRTVPPGQGVVPLTAQGASRGQRPQVDYLTGRTLHRADGSTVDLPAAYADVATYHGGFLATEFAAGEYEVVQLDNTGKEVDRQPGDARLVVSADGLEVSWFTTPGPGQQGHLHRGIASGMGDVVDDQPTPAGVQVSPVGFSGPGQVVYQRYGVEPQVWVTDFAGGNRRLPGLLAAGGTSQDAGLLNGQVSSSDTGSCWVVRAISPGGAGTDRWRTCDWSLGAFSPGGKYVLAGPAYRDGIGDPEVAVLDAGTGAVVAHWQRPRSGDGFTNASVWEDGTDLLTSLYEDGAWHLLRLNVSGAVSETLAPVPGTSDEHPWVLLPR